MIKNERFNRIPKGNENVRYNRLTWKAMQIDPDVRNTGLRTFAAADKICTETGLCGDSMEFGKTGKAPVALTVHINPKDATAAEIKADYRFGDETCRLILQIDKKACITGVSVKCGNDTVTGGLAIAESRYYGKIKEYAEKIPGFDKIDCIDGNPDGVKITEGDFADSVYHHKCVRIDKDIKLIILRLGDEKLRSLVNSMYYEMIDFYNNLGIKGHILIGARHSVSYSNYVYRDDDTPVHEVTAIFAPFGQSEVKSSLTLVAKKVTEGGSVKMDSMHAHEYDTVLKKTVYANALDIASTIQNKDVCNAAKYAAERYFK